MPNLGNVPANSEAVDGVNMDRCVLVRTANVSTAYDGTLLGTNNWLTFPTGSATEQKSLSGMHSLSTNSERIYCNAAGLGGTWHINVIVTFDISVNGVRVVYLDFVQPTPVLTTNIVNYAVLNTGNSSYTPVGFSLDYSSTASDPAAYFALRTAQNSGAALNVMATFTRFSVRRVGGAL